MTKPPSPYLAALSEISLAAAWPPGQRRRPRDGSARVASSAGRPCGGWGWALCSSLPPGARKGTSCCPHAALSRSPGLLRSPLEACPPAAGQPCLGSFLGAPLLSTPNTTPKSQPGWGVARIYTPPPHTPHREFLQWPPCALLQSPDHQPSPTGKQTYAWEQKGQVSRWTRA